MSATTNTNTATRSKATKASRNKTQDFSDRALTVYDAEMKHCFTVPQDRVVQTPNPMPKDRQLCLCTVFTECGECPRGESCTSVHANVDGLEKLAIHINFAWKNAASVSYARLAPGDTLTVLAPNNRPPLEQLPSEFVLVTKGSLASRQQSVDAANPPARPLSHCAHYYFNRVCNRGELCSFIHSVNIDSSAEEGQRASAPQVVHRSTKSATPASSSISPSNSDAHQTSKNAATSDKSLEACTKQCVPECSEGGYTSDDSACSGQTAVEANGKSQAALTTVSPTLGSSSLDSSSTASRSGSTTPVVFRGRQQIYEVCANRILILSPANKEVVAFRHNPYTNQFP